MTKDDILTRLRKWEYDWTHHLSITGGPESFDKGANVIKGYALKRLHDLLKESE